MIVIDFHVDVGDDDDIVERQHFYNQQQPQQHHLRIRHSKQDINNGNVNMLWIPLLFDSKFLPPE